MNNQNASSSAEVRARLMPRHSVPNLRFETLYGAVWDLDHQTPDQFMMVVFYRGLHCPVCQTYLKELDHLLPEFTKRGIGVVAVSSDSRDRAQTTKEKWGLKAVTIGYELSIGKAREWGLYISASRGLSSSGIEEPPVFSEPGLFVMRPDRTLYWASTSTMPFVRPHFNEMIQAFDFVKKLNYPARGEL